jgi:hypothetical protein
VAQLAQAAHRAKEHRPARKEKLPLPFLRRASENSQIRLRSQLRQIETLATEARGISIGVKIGRRVRLPHQVKLGACIPVDPDVLRTTDTALVRKRTTVLAVFLHGGKLRYGARGRNSTGLIQNLLASFVKHVYLRRMDESRETPSAAPNQRTHSSRSSYLTRRTRQIEAVNF